MAFDEGFKIYDRVILNHNAHSAPIQTGEPPELVRPATPNAERGRQDDKVDEKEEDFDTSAPHSHPRSPPTIGEEEEHKTPAIDSDDKETRVLPPAAEVRRSTRVRKPNLHDTTPTGLMTQRAEYTFIAQHANPATANSGIPDDAEPTTCRQGLAAPDDKGLRGCA